MSKYTNSTTFKILNSLKKWMLMHEYSKTAFDPECFTTMFD